MAITKAPAFERVRCHFCRRVLTWKEFAAGLAHVRRTYSWSGPDDLSEHTYDCENEPRRKP